MKVDIKRILFVIFFTLIIGFFIALVLMLFKVDLGGVWSGLGLVALAFLGDWVHGRYFSYGK